MKKWLVFALILSVAGLAKAQGMGGGGVQGREGGGPRMGEGGDMDAPPRMEEGHRPPPPLTLERFVQHEKRMAEKKGEEFDLAAAEAKFAELDKNQDGVLTPDEFKPERKKEQHREGMKEGGGDGGAEGSAEQKGAKNGGSDGDND